MSEVAKKFAAPVLKKLYGMEEGSKIFTANLALYTIIQRMDEQVRPILNVDLLTRRLDNVRTRLQAIRSQYPFLTKPYNYRVWVKEFDKAGVPREITEDLLAEQSLRIRYFRKVAEGLLKNQLGQMPGVVSPGEFLQFIYEYHTGTGMCQDYENILNMRYSKQVALGVDRCETCGMEDIFCTCQDCDCASCEAADSLVYGACTDGNKVRVTFDINSATRQLYCTSSLLDYPANWMFIAPTPGKVVVRVSLAEGMVYIPMNVLAPYLDESLPGTLDTPWSTRVGAVFYDTRIEEVTQQHRIQVERYFQQLYFFVTRPGDRAWPMPDLPDDVVLTDRASTLINSLTMLANQTTKGNLYLPTGRTYTLAPGNSVSVLSVVYDSMVADMQHMFIVEMDKAGYQPYTVHGQYVYYELDGFTQQDYEAGEKVMFGEPKRGEDFCLACEAAMHEATPSVFTKAVPQIVRIESFSRFAESR